MIAPASLIGFGLAALLATWLASVLLAATMWLARRRLAAGGPAVERLAAALALIGAPALGLVVLAALLGHSASEIASGSGDHCSLHGHHAHLCLVHGAAWLHEPWAVVALAMVGTYVGVRLLQRAAGLVSATRATRRLARVARRDGGAWIAPADAAFCFVAGLRQPRIFVSSRAWSALDDEERAGMLAHEQAHIDQHDLAWRSGLATLSLFGAPLVGARLLDAWSRATERLCDARATAHAAPEAVAQALVTMARLSSHQVSPGLAFGSARDLETRVQALLQSLPTGGVLARRLAIAASTALAAVGLAAMLLADPLHHVLETVLGVF